MRGVIQRVKRAAVRVDGETVGSIELGLCALVGVAADDSERDAELLADKILGLRIFEDAEGKMNLCLGDVGGALLAISQFTLLGDVRKGRRPSFGTAMEPEAARELFERFVSRARSSGAKVETGRFRAHMEVELVNSGPVTILVDTKRLF